MSSRGARSPVVIRPARPQEAAALTNLAHRAKASWGYPTEWLAEWGPLLTFTPDSIGAHTTLVAELVGRFRRDPINSFARGASGLTQLAHRHRRVITLAATVAQGGRGVKRNAFAGRMRNSGLSLNVFTEDELQEVHLFSITGQKFASVMKPGTQAIIQTSGYPPGVYIVQLRLPGKRLTQKIVIR